MMQICFYNEGYNFTNNVLYNHYIIHPLHYTTITLYNHYIIQPLHYTTTVLIKLFKLSFVGFASKS